jgi:hypothetical protein
VKIEKRIELFVTVCENRGLSVRACPINYGCRLTIRGECEKRIATVTLYDGKKGPSCTKIIHDEDYAAVIERACLSALDGTSRESRGTWNATKEITEYGARLRALCITWSQYRTARELNWAPLRAAIRELAIYAHTFDRTINCPVDQDDVDSYLKVIERLASNAPENEASE